MSEVTLWRFFRAAALVAAILGTVSTVTAYVVGNSYDDPLLATVFSLFVVWVCSLYLRVDDRARRDSRFARTHRLRNLTPPPDRMTAYNPQTRSWEDV